MYIKAKSIPDKRLGRISDGAFSEIARCRMLSPGDALDLACILKPSTREAA